MDAVMYMLREHKITSTVKPTSHNPWMDEEDIRVPMNYFVAEFFHPEGMRFTGYWGQGYGVEEDPNAAQILRQIFDDIADLDRYTGTNFSNRKVMQGVHTTDDLGMLEWAYDLWGVEPLDNKGLRPVRKTWKHLKDIKEQLENFWGWSVFNEIIDNLEEGIGEDEEVPLEEAETSEIVVEEVPQGDPNLPPLLYKKAVRKVPGKDWGYKRDVTIVVRYGFDMKFAESHEQAPYFTMTYEVRPPGWFEGRDIIGFGTLGEDKAKYFKRIAHLERWHLVAWPHDPMHYYENGLFWLEKCLGISKWENKSYEKAEEAFKNTVVFGVHPGDEAFWEKISGEFLMKIETEYVKRGLREALAPLFKRWCEKRKDAIEGAFLKDMKEAGLLNGNPARAMQWVPDGRFHYPCFGYISDQDHDTGNEGLKMPYVRSLDTDQGYNDTAQTDPKVTDGIGKPHRTYAAAMKFAQTFAEFFHARRSFASET